MVKTRLKDLFEKIKSLSIDDILLYINKKNVTLFIYYTVISLTGIVFLIAISNSNYAIPFAINVMFAWLLLIILFPIPDSAKTEITPLSY